MRFVAALLVCAPTGASAEPSEWLPLAAERRMVYEAHRDHSFRPEKGSIDRLFHQGRAVQRQRDASAIAPGAVAIEERIELVPVGGGRIERTIEARVLEATSEGVLMHASGGIAHEGESPAHRYSPALRLLTSDAPEHTWKVGTYRDRDMQVELRAEVRGVGRLDAEPGCESCLEVRYFGPITGRIPVADGPAEIESGRFERTVWMKRGVGIVREVGKVETELLLPDETRASTSHTMTLRLLESDAR